MADSWGLSVSTISQATNGSYGVHPKTVARVQETADALSYLPNLDAQQPVPVRAIKI
ncbi:LacI family DNA-binding transcriptional regulator [Paenibacillus sp. FSL R5-0527]|uniref:LacI family DNA-binding transcriptional regulator n=1 Tax=Paenibacillus sp. FSL R5-0527 TaxID=2975321 RepID=UPI004048E09E